MLIEPCACRLSREAAMTCSREIRGELIWSPAATGEENPLGPIEVVTPDGRREILAFGHEWMHFDEQGARDHARIRHLTFRQVGEGRVVAEQAVEHEAMLVEPDPTRTCRHCGTSWVAPVVQCPECCRCGPNEGCSAPDCAGTIPMTLGTTAGVGAPEPVDDIATESRSSGRRDGHPLICAKDARDA